MSNIHGLFSNRGKKDDNNNNDHDDDDDDDDANNRYVGGISARGGGSGLAVLPNPNEQGGSSSSSAPRDIVFGLAEEASSSAAAGGEGEGSSSDEQVRRTITMYQNGFIVDDGPYRRLDDPANGEFLRALAMGRTPRELVESTTASSTTADGTTPMTNNSNNNIVVGLIDKRNEDYIEPFRSFSGTGETLGTTTVPTDGVFDPNTLPDTPSVSSDDGTETTSIAVRLPNGKRKIVKIALSATITDVAIQLRNDAEQMPFRIMSGFPPQPLTDVTCTIEAAGLKGAQISMHKV